MTETPTIAHLPLSLGQSGLWVNESVGGVGSVYSMPFALTFEGELDVPALVSAVEAVVRRHPVLGAAVLTRADGPALGPAATSPGVRIRAGDDLDRRVREEIARPFDLADGPLSRFTLFTVAPQRHLLLVVAHHLVFDGQSTDLVIRDLAGFYRAHRTGAAPELPELTGSVEDLVSEEATRVAAALPQAREFWATRWRKPAEPVLPGRLGPVRAVDAGESVEFAVPEAVRVALDAAGRSLGVSRFELILASWHALLLRYGNEEPTIALDLGTRTAATRERVGLFVNELPVTGRPVPAATFAGYVRQLRGELRELYRFREVPLARAVPALKPTVALAAITLTYRRRSSVAEFPGLRVTADWVRYNGIARGALRIHLVEGPDGFGAMLQFSPRTLAPAAVQRLSKHWLTLLTTALNAPDTPLAELPVLVLDERATLRRTWNRTAIERAPRTVLDLFGMRVSAAPGATAVICGTTRLSYAELDAAANRVAYRLRELGTGPGSIVAIHAERGAELVTAMLGVLKAGAAYLPLDPTHPTERLIHILNDAAVTTLLTHGPNGDALPGYPGQRIPLADLTADPQPPPASGPAPLPAVGSADRAYVIYTSGSTGRPKGVEVGHAALANLLLAMRERLNLDAGTRWLAVTSPSFDISALELLLPLIVGGQVVVAGDADVKDGPALCRLVAAHGITHIQATPSGWRLLLAAGFNGPGVTALCGGEALPGPLARQLRARVDALWNVYGPTETTIWSTSWAVPVDVDEVRIGRPIANTQAYVLDSRRAPVPIGVPGELYLGGDGLADGYLGQPELTRERFVFDPVGQRLYRTGDLVRYDEDGNLIYLGRLDDQVKIRGYRIELGEIEARLLEHPSVLAAAVAVRADEAGEQHLLACVVPAPEAAPEPTELRAHLARTLPDYMLPTALVTVPTLPLTPNGKLDRQALPDLPRTPAQPAPPQAAPAGELTAQVAAICAEVLHRDGVGAHDSLFDLGAHSLTMTGIAARIRRRLGADLPLHLFYDDPTPVRLADAIAALRAEA